MDGTWRRPGSPRRLCPVFGVFPMSDEGMTRWARAQSCAAVAVLALYCSACDVLEAVFGRPQQGPKFVLLLPEQSEGWTCVDFGVAGEPELTREGAAWLLDASGGHLLRTSSKPEGLVAVLPEQAFRTVAGRRSPLPPGIDLRRSTSDTDTKSPVSRHCVFYGTEAQSESAPDAPELVRPVDTSCPADTGTLSKTHDAEEGDEAVPARLFMPRLSPETGPSLLKAGVTIGLVLISVPPAYWCGVRVAAQVMRVLRTVALEVCQPCWTTARG